MILLPFYVVGFKQTGQSIKFRKSIKNWEISIVVDATGKKASVVYGGAERLCALIPPTVPTN